MAVLLIAVLLITGAGDAASAVGSWMSQAKEGPGFDPTSAEIIPQQTPARTALAETTTKGTGPPPSVQDVGLPEPQPSAAGPDTDGGQGWSSLIALMIPALFVACTTCGLLLLRPEGRARR